MYSRVIELLGSTLLMTLQEHSNALYGGGVSSVEKSRVDTAKIDDTSIVR